MTDTTAVTSYADLRRKFPLVRADVDAYRSICTDLGVELEKAIAQARREDARLETLEARRQQLGQRIVDINRAFLVLVDRSSIEFRDAESSLRFWRFALNSDDYSTNLVSKNATPWWPELDWLNELLASREKHVCAELRSVTRLHELNVHQLSDQWSSWLA